MNARWLRLVLQSRKARVSLVVFLFLIFGVSALFLPRNKEYTGTPSAALGSFRKEEVNRLNRDEDGDGLKTWEEEIFRTNPENPDTDGDGISDGKEIAENTNPLNPLPDARLTEGPGEQENAPSAKTPANITRYMTDLLQKEYLARRIARPNEALDPENAGEALAQQALEHFQTIARNKRFIEKDIIIGKNTSARAAAAYIDTFNAIAKKTIQAIDQPDVISLAFVDALEKEDYDALSVFDSYISAYDAFFLEIRTVTVPENFAAIHLDYLNTASRQQNSLAIMQNAGQDSVGSLAAFREYLDATEYFENIGRASQVAHQKTQTQ